MVVVGSLTLQKQSGSELLMDDEEILNDDEGEALIGEEGEDDDDTFIADEEDEGDDGEDCVKDEDGLDGDESTIGEDGDDGDDFSTGEDGDEGEDGEDDESLIGEEGDEGDDSSFGEDGDEGDEGDEGEGNVIVVVNSGTKVSIYELDPIGEDGDELRSSVLLLSFEEGEENDFGIETQHSVRELEYISVVVVGTSSIIEDDSNSELDSLSDELNLPELGTGLYELALELCEENSGVVVNFDSGIEDKD